ncbi:hypothetical protein [Niabella ginsenosidivorans]|nr:hypothetical protein [Niabella ginsenosidivorans]
MEKYSIAVFIALFFAVFYIHAQDATRLIMADTRYKDLPAASYNRGFFGDFRRSDSISAPVGASSFGGLLTIAPWLDATGGKKHQLFFNIGGIYYRQGVHGQPNWEKWQKVLVEDTSGRVSIGTTAIPAGYRLAVAGKIIGEEVKVKLQSSGWPDYVFTPSYQLMPLDKVEAFIEEHGHLPDVPSAKEVAEKGVEVGANQAILLKKIEELTLYILEQDKKYQDLYSKYMTLEKKINK